MQLSEVLKQITTEARILEAHLARGSVDPRFVQIHADSLVNYGLLLRDLSLERHGQESETKKGSKQRRSSAFDLFGDL